MSQERPAEEDGSRRRPRRARRVLIAVVGTLIVALLGAGGVLGYARYRYDQIHKVDIGSTAFSPTGTMNILLAGDNCRACLNGKQSNAFGTGAEVGGGRSDVTMVLHLDLSTGKAALLSIPRDLFLPLPGTDRANRIDAALNSGPKALVAQIEDDLGIPIDHYLAVNFDTFQSIVDDLGGIDMYFADPVKDAQSALNVATTGCVHLNGFQALAVVRSRHLYYYQGGYWHYDGFGDLSRIKRDHVFLQVMATAVEGQLTNPFKINSIMGTLAPQLEVDSGLSLPTMISLVRQFRHLDPAGVPTYTLPIVVDPNPYYYRGANYGDVVFPDYPADAQTVAAFLGTPVPAPSPAGVTVSVLNGTGAYNQAARTATALAALGYSVSGAADTTHVGTPAETTVYYAPGHRADAIGLAARLSGLVAVGSLPTGTTASTAPTAAGSSVTDPALASGAELTVVTGTGFVVSPPPSATTTTTGRSAAKAVPATTTTVALGAGLGAPTPAQEPAPSFDPTACPTR
ncbi:MAG TPA: LCP family protein [Acidimicrobiales bacterium]|nr:LCP family protein [Acidimicrobiales bacterium]